MNLWGVENTYADGRYRVFAEYANTNANSLPWEPKPMFPGYVNWVYALGYTNGGRWLGASQVSGSQMSTLGWMDAANMQMAKLHFGRIGSSLGVYAPAIELPHGRMWGVSAQQTWLWKGMSFTPELAYIRFTQSAALAGNQRHSLRAGMAVAVGL
jgi:hypothetical protein